MRKEKKLEIHGNAGKISGYRFNIPFKRQISRFGLKNNAYNLGKNYVDTLMFCKRFQLNITHLTPLVNETTLMGDLV